jgi:hypothetical protein
METENIPKDDLITPTENPIASDAKPNRGRKRPQLKR